LKGGHEKTERQIERLNALRKKMAEIPNFFETGKSGGGKTIFWWHT
jgi:hypothetical protein